MDFLESVLDLLTTLTGEAGAPAAVFALGVAGLTLSAGALLNPERKVELALWLMGAQSEGSWARSFNAMFDALFGERHLSWRCFRRSAVASLLAAALIWTVMGGFGAIGARFEALPIWSVLGAALVVNVLADWLSLLETRWLLGRLERWRSAWAQVAVLAADLVFSALIILAALFAYVQAAPFLPEALAPPGVREGGWDFASILGVFSVLSVLFYSTFLTSVWSWAYVLSTWLLRLFVGWNLAHWLDVARRPVLILSVVLGLTTFLGSLGAVEALRRDEAGLSVADRALCQAFKGEVCLKVGGLTDDEQAKLDLLLLACEGGLTENCLRRGLASFEDEPVEATRLLNAACEGGEAFVCTGLGRIHRRGIVIDRNIAEAARLFRQGCDGGDAQGCTLLGVLHEQGIGMDPDPAEAARLYRQGCDGGDAGGCTTLGFLHAQGIGMDADPAEAARLYRQGCDGGDVDGCTSLGVLHEEGVGMDLDPAEAARLYRQGCEGGNANGCGYLGDLVERGEGVEPDLDAAITLYREGCDGGSDYACDALTRLGVE